MLAQQTETRAKSTDFALRESEIRYRRLFETAQDGILLLDAQTGKVTDVNPFLIQLLGYPREELLGKKLWELGFLKDREASKEAFATLQRTGYVRYDDLPLETKQGRHIEVEFVSNVYMVGLEHVIQCNIRDVSERKQLEHLKDDFLSTVSHEIRTPLSNLKMGVDNLEEICAGKQEKNVSEIIDVLKRNADRLVRLINDLLDLSRFESGKIGPFLQNIQISSLVEEVIQGSMSLAKERGLTLKGEYEKDLPGLMADRDLLVRVLTNLLDNALRFAKSEIIVKARKFGLHLQVSVFNDGVGIKPEYIPALFNKFIQINRPLGGNGYKGTGLGLAICNGIIKLHEGKIWAESLGGQGTQFNFSIPLKASRAHE